MHTVQVVLEVCMLFKVDKILRHTQMLTGVMTKRSVLEHEPHFLKQSLLVFAHLSKGTLWNIHVWTIQKGHQSNALVKS